MSAETNQAVETAKAAKKVRGFRKKHEEKREKIKDQNRATGKALKSFWSSSVTGSKVLAHNGIIFLIWAVLMAVIAYASLQLAFYFVAMVLAETGGILMETAVDVITVYVVIIMCCGLDLFFTMKIESAVIRAMQRRFWHACPGGIDKGEIWRRKHMQDVTENAGQD